MEYALDNALYQWEDGQRRVALSESATRVVLERAVAAVLEEMRRRLGSSFRLEELVAFYARGVDWAEAIAAANGAGVDGFAVIDAAFARYARYSGDFAGGRPRERLQRD